MIELKKLPFAEDALEPFISKETIEFHYHKHHASYVKNLNDLIKGTKYDELALSSIIRDSEGAMFNNAAQTFNHDFYWKSLCAKSTPPEGKLLAKIKEDFGSLDALKEEFLKKGATLFGSGWVWLVREPKGQLMLKQTSNADTPLSYGAVPLFVCDVWEHAYYIDFRNARPNYLAEFWGHINWEFAQKTYEATDNDVFIAIEPCNDIHDPFCQILDEMQNNDRVTS